MSSRSANVGHSMPARGAAAKRDFDTQQKIILQHPEWFSQKDRLWLRESQLAAQLRQAREAGDKAALEGVYRGLGEIIGQAEENSEIHIQAKRDRMAASIALGRDKEALSDYHALSKWQEQPEYVKEQYKQALSMNRKPITARKDAPPYLVDKGTLVDALGNPIPPMDRQRGGGNYVRRGVQQPGQGAQLAVPRAAAGYTLMFQYTGLHVRRSPVCCPGLEWVTTLPNKLGFYRPEGRGLYH